ncbi:MAG: 16S rRNA (uracil(1498)-N(3))-methyltransferase [Gammaproteobacteria bacterium]|nr:16S rRNA (uracil(1498)-N(3))-methyltransferase [Gammaproteobacteria bacterium]
MRIPRLYHPDNLHGLTTVELSKESAHYLGRVLRLTPASPIILFDGSGLEYPGRIEHLGRSDARVILEAPLRPAVESPLRIELQQGISRGERMDYTLQKAVELGVAALTPVITRRSVVQFDRARQEKRLQHWHGVIVAACEQSGRTCPPRLADITPLDDFLRPGTGELRLLLDPEADTTARALPPPDSGRVTLLVGPEGGLDEEERALARQAGYVGVRLGPRVLRTETAGLAAIAVLQHLWGDLG